MKSFHRKGIKCFHVWRTHTGTNNIIRCEVHSAQVLRKRNDLSIGVFSAKRSTCQDILHILSGINSCPKSAHQERSFHARCTLINMCFIQDNETQLCTCKNFIIIRTQHHIFQHGIVCNQDVRRITLHFFTGDYFVRGRLHPIYPMILASSFRLGVFGVTIIEAKANLRIPFQQITHTLDLIVCQSVHRIDHNGTNRIA